MAVITELFFQSLRPFSIDKRPGSSLAGIFYQCKCKTITAKVDLVNTFHVRTSHLLISKIEYSHCIAVDLTVTTNLNFSQAIHQMTGIGVDMKSNRIIDRLTDISLPAPVANRLRMDRGCC